MTWIGFLRAIGLLSPAGEAVSVPYGVFKEQLRLGNVAEITIAGRGIQGIFHRPVATVRPSERTAGKAITRFGTTLPPCGDGELVALLTAKRVTVCAATPEDGWADNLPGLRARRSGAAPEEERAGSGG